MPKIDVLIENPLPSGIGKTNLNRAKRFVKSGRAVFTAPLIIRFVNAAAQSDLERRMHSRTAFSYDGVHGDWRKHARGIPVIHPEKLLL